MTTGEGRAYAERRWQDFQSLDRMASHWWWRPGWQEGRRYHTWHLTFEDAPEVAALVASCQRRISATSLDPVPVDGLHLTMQGVGFSDEVSDGVVWRIVAAARERLAGLPPFMLELGPAYAETEGLPLAIEPWEPVQRLRRELRSAIAEVQGEQEVPDPDVGFVPHVTILYSNADTPADPIRRQVAGLRDTPPVRMCVRRVSLITLGRDEHVYRWETVESVPLGPRRRGGRGAGRARRPRAGP